MSTFVITNYSKLKRKPSFLFKQVLEILLTHLTVHATHLSALLSSRPATPSPRTEQYSTRFSLFVFTCSRRRDSGGCRIGGASKANPSTLSQSHSYPAPKEHSPLQKADRESESLPQKHRLQECHDPGTAPRLARGLPLALVPAPFQERSLSSSEPQAGNTCLWRSAPAQGCPSLL